MRKSILLFVAPFISWSVLSQTLDIDKIYQKYKDLKTVTIHTADGDIEAKIKITLNSEGKPSSIILYNWVAFQDVTIERIMASLESAKEKTGYKNKGSSTVFFEGEFVTTSLYEKGTQYAKYGLQKEMFRNLPSLEDQQKESKKPVGSFFYFEVGDIQRSANGQGKNFEF